MHRTLRLIALVLALALACGSALADSGIGDAAYDCATTTKTTRKTSPSVRTDADVAGISESSSGVEAVNTAYESENSTRGFVYRMYKTVLGREPEEDGFNWWVRQLESGKSTAAELVDGFFNSKEYKAKGKSNEQILDDCYQAMMNRGPDAGGKQYWMDRLNVGMSSSAVCAGFVTSNEFKALAAKYGIRPGSIKLTNARDQKYAWTSFVYRLYNDCLERTPETDGIEYWCKQLMKGKGGAEVAAGFVFSNEYKNRLPGNDVYVQMLYRTILGRPSEAAGLDYWVEKLDYTNSREHVLNGFMSSREFYEKCVAAGLVVGKKVAEPENTAAWRANVLILSLANLERDRYGLPRLKTREDLWERVAEIRAAEVRTLQSHTRPDGSPWTTAYDDAGFEYLYAGENIAWGFKNEQSVMEAWMNSEGHRKNILDTGFEYLATGRYANQYWSQNFYTGWD